MRTARGTWSLAGLVAGAAGVATSYLVAMAMTIRDSPVVAVAELVIRFVPGSLAERAIAILGHWDKPILLAVIFLLLAALFAYAGRLAARSWWAPAVVFAVLAGIASLAVLLRRGDTAGDQLPVAVGFVTWVVCLSLLTEPLRRAARRDEARDDGAVGDGAGDSVGEDRLDDVDTADESSRRSFLVRAGVLGVLAVAATGIGQVVGRGRRHVEETRRLLKISGVTEPKIPDGARIGLAGIDAW